MKIKLIGPNNRVKKRKPTFEEIGLRHQMSQFYSLKSTMEALFGHPIYMELKETTDLAIWRKAMKKLLDAIEVSIKHSVKVADADWHHAVESVLIQGRERVKGAQTAADLFAGLTSTLTEIVFTQIGFMPTRSERHVVVPLKKDFWEMKNFRTVQYVQTAEQKATLERHRAVLAARQPKADG